MTRTTKTIIGLPPNFKMTYAAGTFMAMIEDINIW